MAQEVDRDFGMALLQIQEADIEAVLKGLLGDSEIHATILRFRSVKEKIQQMAQAGTLTGTWDETTLERDRAKQFTHRAGHTSYEPDGGQLDQRPGAPADQRCVHGMRQGRDGRSAAGHPTRSSSTIWRACPR